MTYVYSCVIDSRGAIMPLCVLRSPQVHDRGAPGRNTRTQDRGVRGRLITFFFLMGRFRFWIETRKLYWVYRDVFIFFFLCLCTRFRPQTEKYLRSSQLIMCRSCIRWELLSRGHFEEVFYLVSRNCFPSD